MCAFFVLLLLLLLLSAAVVALLLVLPLLLVSCFFLWQGLTQTWEELCGRDTQYLSSMRAVLDHTFGKGADGNGIELFLCISERGLDGQVGWWVEGGMEGKGVVEGGG